VSLPTGAEDDMRIRGGSMPANGPGAGNSNSGVHGYYSKIITGTTLNEGWWNFP